MRAGPHFPTQGYIEFPPPPPPHPPGREILLQVEVSAEKTKIDHKDIYLQKWEMSRFVLRKQT